ncbi:PAS domain-containing sensor histidine kinase [Mucilaginibacter sp.]
MSGNDTLILESETSFKALFQYATIGILVVNSDGIIEMANPCIEKIFGYSQAELSGQPVELLLPKAFRQSHVHHREYYCKNPKARSMGYDLSLFAHKKDGCEFRVEIRLGHYQLNDKNMAVAFVTDITDRTQTFEELEAKVIERTVELTSSLKREKGLSEIKSIFVAMASHEFRTPLSAIVSSLSLIATYNKDTLDEKSLKHIKRIRSSIANLTGILNNFLSLEKVEQGKMEVNNQTFDLYAFAEDIIEEMDGILKQGQQIDLAYKGQANIFQDKKNLRNILLNLLSNAVKYSDEGKHVHFSIVNSDQKISLTVRDEGIGVPLDEQENLFSKFYRARNVSNIQGTGLGLTIVKSYIELLGGAISFTSELNVGTTFFVEFPKILTYENDCTH